MSKPVAQASRAQLAAAIEAIVKNQLDDCERAIKAGTRSIALYELEDAQKRLREIARLLRG
ncbi:MAG: hypothetical protein JO048_08440 [Methylobacteriaceae bacterium]|nr:hypothetical protein [Methylobacteriaceae bacterium]